MNCTIVYGLSRSMKHQKTLPAAKAFQMIPDLNRNGWMFINIYHDGRLVYTDQGLAGYRFICKGCPYEKGAKQQ